MIRAVTSWLCGMCGVLCLASPVPAGPVNLAPNGSFELGNTQFSSDYTFSPADNPTESQYAVLTSPHPWNPNFIVVGDHTTGAGLMFVGNGSPNTSERVWFSTGVAVTPGTDYFFEAFVMNVEDVAKFPQGADPVTFSNLSFFANGTLLGTRKTEILGQWQGLGTVWNSGGATTVDLEIRNANDFVIGNDFAVDDIYLGLGTTIASVPEPSTFTLSLLAGVALCLAAFNQRRQR